MPTMIAKKCAGWPWWVRNLAQAERPATFLVPSNPDDAERLLSRVRTSRGLGERRYGALLRRSAMLRALVQDEVTIDESAVATQFAIRHGEKRRCRIIVTTSAGAAAAARERVERLVAQDPSSPLAGHFANVAVDVSIDPSARLAASPPGVAGGAGGSGWGGGTIEPFSVLDASYPAAIRQAALALSPGQMSPVIVLERSAAVLFLDGIDPPTDISLDAARPEIVADLRTRLERQRMDALVSRTLQAGGVTVLDRSLGWSWDNLAKPPAP